MHLEDHIRDRVKLIGGKVAGVDCPHCEYAGTGIELEAHELAAVTCPACEETVLTADEKGKLRRAGKL